MCLFTFMNVSVCPDLLCNTPQELFAPAAGAKTSSETSSDDSEPPVQSKPAQVVKGKAGAKQKINRSRTNKHKVPGMGNVNSQKPYDPTPASGTETGGETGGEGGAGAGDDSCAMDDEALAQLQKQVKKLEAKVSPLCPVAHLQIPG